MRRILYPVYFALLFIFVSCSKGDQVTDPSFGIITFTSIVPQSIRIVRVTDGMLSENANSFNVVSGKNNFRFYFEDKLLLDTALSAESYKTHNYILIKPNDNSSLRIVDAEVTGLNKEPAPESGYVKFSLANLSATLPSKVDVAILTNTYSANLDSPVQVGEFNNVSDSFSAFQKITLGINRTGGSVNTFTLIIKDASNHATLATTSLTLPIGITAGDIGQLKGSVYILCLQNNGNASILMSK